MPYSIWGISATIGNLEEAQRSVACHPLKMIRMKNQQGVLVKSKH